MRSQPTLNQTGELKAAYWRTRMWTSSSWNVALSSAVLKYPCAYPPVADGFGDAGDELADSGFALGSADLAVQIFAGHDVGGGHGPVFGDLDVLLFEDHAALGVGDLGEAEIPLEFVVGGDAGLGEDAAEGGRGPSSGVSVIAGRPRLASAVGGFDLGHCFLH